jgi:hypothetical protein
VYGILVPLTKIDELYKPDSMLSDHLLRISEHCMMPQYGLFVHGCGGKVFLCDCICVMKSLAQILSFHIM